jgi:hypothetical protein
MMEDVKDADDELWSKGSGGVNGRAANRPDVSASTSPSKSEAEIRDGR